jgi:ribonuclease P protein component
MLPKTHRLRARKDFDRLFRQGRSFGNRMLSGRLRKTDPQAPPRLAFVISAKTAKKAVIRNRARRQLREIVRPLLPSLPRGLDISITIKLPFLSLPFAEKKRVVHELLKRSRLLPPKF